MPSFCRQTLLSLTVSCIAFPAAAQTLSTTPSRRVEPVAGLSAERPRVIVSTDIGGTDPDDFQSLVHLLVYADSLDIEGLIASPYGIGRVKDIHDVIECYEEDYANLSTYSKSYPTPDSLRAIAKQGETERAPYAGVRESTDGSRLIVECARRHDPRPLNVLVWGGLEDLAQALHDAPDILPKLRVYWIGGPNKKWSPDAYQFIVDHHPTLWMIESNATYRGLFTGGNQSGDWGNEEFVAQHIQGRAALGNLFVTHKADLKMGDTASVGWLLNGNPDDPGHPSWGGSYVPAWKRPHLKLTRLPRKPDRIEVFGILELALPAGDVLPDTKTSLIVENQRLDGHLAADGSIHFRFSPKASKRYRFRIASDLKSLDGMSGSITAYSPEAEVASQRDPRLPNWWTDDLSADNSEGPHSGAKTVNRWRTDFLSDFASRMRRCEHPASPVRNLNRESP